MPYKFNPFTGTLDEVGTGGGGGATNLDGLTDVTIAAPSDWEVLGYNATSGLWENTSHIHASVAGNLYVHIKNTDSVQLDKGTPFYITGTVGASDQVEVQAADNTDPTKGPAIGLVEDNLPINAEGNGVLIGEIYNYDTATPGWSTNDALYVSAAGAITNAQPASGYRQIVGYVGRVHASTGTIVVLGNQKDPVAGSDTEIQFNDNGGFGASADLTWDDTNKELGVGGDINLDDGGTFSTTVQSVTPTANRTISFPDATGTVALVSGADGTIQYNDAGTLKGNSDFTVDPDWNDASTVFTGLKLNVTNTASLNGSSLIDLSIGGTSLFKHGYDYVSNANTVTLDSANLVHINSNGGTIVSFYGANNASQPLTVRTIAGIGLGAIGAQTFFRSDQAHALALRSSTSPQTFRIYNTVSQNNLDFERTSLTRDSSGLVIDAQKGGTGVDPTNLLDLKLDGTSRFSVAKTGWIQSTDALYGLTVIATGSGTPVLVGSTSNLFLNSSLSFSNNNPANAPDVGFARDSAGVLKITDGSTGTGYLRQVPIAVASLPTAAAGNAGTRIFVSDASVAAAGNFGSVVAGGGSNTVPVYSDGGAWRIG